MNAPAWLGAVTTRRPAQVLLAALLVALLAGLAVVDLPGQRLRLSFDPAMDVLIPPELARALPRDGPAAVNGSDDLLLVAWRGADLFTPAALAAFAGFADAVARQDGVAAVDSLATALDLRTSEDTTAVEPFLATPPATAGAAADLRERALANPLVRDVLVTAAGDGLLLAVRFEAGLDRAALGAGVAQVTALAMQRAGGREVLVGGPLRLRRALGDALERDLLRVTPLAMLATLVVAALALGNLRGVLVAVCANGLATLATLGCFAVTGGRLDFVTAGLVPVVYVVGFAYAVHVVCAFERHLGGPHASRAARADAVLAALSETWRPLLLTALTTVIAFAALGVSELGAIRRFGAYCALGAVFAWGSAVSVVPALLVCLPAQARSRGATGTRLTRWLARRAGGRSGTVTLAAAACLAVAAALAATGIEVDTTLLDQFAIDHPVRRDFERLAATTGGPVPLQVVVEADDAEGFQAPAALAALAALEAWLRAQPGVSGVTGLPDYAALLYRAFDPAGAAQTTLPEDARPYRHSLLLADPALLARFVAADFGTAVLHLRTHALSTAAVDELGARIATRLGALPPGLHGHLGGTTWLSARGVDAITTGQVQSLAVALGAIGLLLALVFRSARLGLWLLVPNALPILGYFGLLGLLPVTLNLTTSLVACAAFGIAIDDTVHLVARYTAARVTGAREQALAGALAAVLRPVTVTSLALCAGFCALGASTLHGQVEFGLLAAATLALAWLVDVTVTPALLARLDPTRDG